MLSTIAKAWYHYIQATAETRQLMDQRLSVCDTCPQKEEHDMLGKIVFQNSPNNLYRCGLCKCPLGALASHPTSQCKANKWP